MTSSLADYAAADQRDAPRHLGSRYNEAGLFLPDPGNTVVCHVASGSTTETALLQARDHIMSMAGDSLAFTAPSSLHMTLFQGILDRRRDYPFWPQGIPLDTAVEAVTSLFSDRLATFEPGPSFAVEAVAILPSGIIVDGITPADRHALAQWRDALADLLGYRDPDHDTYEFHITFAYPIRWLDAAELANWRKLLDELLVAIRLKAPILELRAPAFCRFDDMNRFEELVVLDAKVPA